MEEYSAEVVIVNVVNIMIPVAICLNVHLVTVKIKVNVIVTLDVVSVAMAVFPQQQDSLLKMENSKQCQN